MQPVSLEWPLYQPDNFGKRRWKPTWSAFSYFGPLQSFNEWTCLRKGQERDLPWKHTYLGLLRVPWTARSSNQLILKAISPEYSLKGLKLNLQYSGRPRQSDLLEKPPVLGKIEGKRRRGQQRTRWLECITDSADMNLSKLQKTVKDREAWFTAVREVVKSRRGLATEQQ